VSRILALAILAAPHAAEAQATAKSSRLCFLAPAPLQRLPWYNPFFQRLRELGYVDGQNIIRSSPECVDEPVFMRPDGDG
jgi:hypothetical protein